MSNPKRETITTEAHTLTHADLVQAIAAFAKSKSEMKNPECEVVIRPNNSWVSEGKNEYFAVATLKVQS